MQNKKTIQKDFNRRKFVQHYEHKRLILKTIFHNPYLPPLKRFSALIQLAKHSPKSSKVRIRNRCVLTGRSRGIHNFFRLSRIMIRDLASKGLLPGVIKASW